MLSSISSSRLLATLAAAALAGALLWQQESEVRTHFLNGGFMALVDPAAVAASGVFPGAGEADIVVFGSSRAKESIRPSVLKSESDGRVASAVNHACHSCSSLVQVRNLAASVRGGSRDLPKNLVVTIEPLHAMSRFAPKQPDAIEAFAAGRAAGPAAAVTRARVWNEAFLAWANAAVGDPLYGFLKSASPTQRRPLPLWLRFFGASARDLAAGRSDAVAYNYDFYIVGRANRFFTLLSELDDGFEGHVLKLAARDATRAEAFEQHLSIYRDYVFPEYRPDLLEALAVDLATIRRAGVRIVLVRLPVHDALHALESERAPDFDARVQAVAGKAGAAYLPLQAAMADIAADVDAFTDGSHFESAATVAFSGRLWHLLAPLLDLRG
ncbi:MAG: hypothetical protein HY059_16830 [Proteobacteria bacterium]|nr:hypothetical protein [Pseudomonadota bacterium]